jgi:Mg2+-importing ATPase
VAYRELESGAPVGTADERALTFVGLLRLADPVKPGAAAELDELAQLGIRLTLVTGDGRHVAAHVAREVGLDGGRIVTGGELRRMSDAALVRAAPGVDVFAEVEPTQKERIIVALRKGGLAVGYLGDGINDAAALRAAEVGISVDGATDVTRQAADIVLLRKDLGVLARGVREGRRAFANTLKYVFITTSANFGNMFSMAGASLFAGFLPLLPKQILLLNALSDLPAMAVATDRLDEELVRTPRRWDTHAVRRFMVVFGLLSSAFDTITIAALLALRAAPAVFRTTWFLESVLSEIVVLLVIRTRRPFFRSPPGRALAWSSAAIAAVALLLPFSPLAGALGLVALPPSLVALALAIVAAYAVASEATKHGFYHLAPA